MVSHKISNKKPAIVLDIGNAFTKAGYANHDAPICIIPSKLKEVQRERWLRDITDAKELREVLRAFLRHVYLRELLVSMSERPVIICESLLCAEIWRTTLAQVLLLDFEVPSVTFAPSHLLSIYTLGITTALVVDSGYSETLVLPIYESMVLLNAWQTLPVGGKAVEDNLSQLLNDSAQLEVLGTKQPLKESTEVLTQKQLEDIKVRTCFVTRFDRAQALKETPDSLSPPADVVYPVSGDTMLHIPGRVRESTCEILYKDTEEKTLAHLLLDAVLECAIDTRRKLLSNIVLIGGNCAMPGFKHRLQCELTSLSKTPQYSQKIAVTEFAFHEPPVKENYTAWLGGAILGACSQLDGQALTRETFESNNGLVPDWSNISLMD